MPQTQPPLPTFTSFPPSSIFIIFSSVFVKVNDIGLLAPSLAITHSLVGERRAREHGKRREQGPGSRISRRLRQLSLFTCLHSAPESRRCRALVSRNLVIFLQKTYFRPFGARLSHTTMHVSGLLLLAAAASVRSVSLRLRGLR